LASGLAVANVKPSAGSNPVLTANRIFNKITHMENFSKEEMELRQALADIRKGIIEKLDDLKAKIESDEPFPEDTQDVEFLVDTDDKLSKILNRWYY
jgi:hypothetical protein